MSIPDADLSPARFVLDTPALHHFALAERLDVLQDLLLQDDCWTTCVVTGELKERAEEAGQPLLLNAVGLEWLQVAALNDSMAEIRCFQDWVARIGRDNRNLGEASVLAFVQLHGGVAITDDAGAKRVARRNGINAHGTVWLLARACRQQKMTEVAAGNVVDLLRGTGHSLPCTGGEFLAYARRNGLL
jgi:predicted nucleic acid-binding protein